MTPEQMAFDFDVYTLEKILKEHSFPKLYAALHAEAKEILIKGAYEHIVYAEQEG